MEIVYYIVIPIITSILGGLIAGLFTFLGVKMTIKYENEKKKDEEYKNILENKPRLEISEFKAFEDFFQENDNNTFGIAFLSIKNFSNSVGRAYFTYDKLASDSKNYIYVEYKLKNTGYTEIMNFCITTNLPKNTSIFNFQQKEFFINNNMLNYDVWGDVKYIKTGQEITIRVYYIKDKVVGSNLGNPSLTIWLIDVNNNWWEQKLDAPYNTIDTSYKSSQKNFKNCSDVRVAIECFNNPILW